ncbi:MAG: DUF2334 domain-containing protein [Dyella sp.]|nr:DUF2334 domain-containing protein [Dyella sp.]
MTRSFLIGPPGLKSRFFRTVLAFSAAFGFVSLADAVQPASPSNGGHVDRRMLPAPPQPSSAALPTKLNVVHATRIHAAGLTYVPPTPSNGYTGAPGSNPNRSTLVVYDSTGPYGWLGEAYAVMAANLASHGSQYTLERAVDYAAGDLDYFTGMIYVGSTYNEPIPVEMLDDVLATTKPVLWINDNIWQLSARAANFAGKYGFTPMYFDFSNTLKVTYKGVALQRDPNSVPSGLLQTVINDPTKAQVLAFATNGTGGIINWATKGANLTYIGEIPFSYVGPNDRYLAAVDLIGKVSNPAMLARKHALVRIEDVDPMADPTELRAVADYLYSKHVPFSIAVIPVYVDPNGYYNNGVPLTKRLSQSPAVISALKYMVSKGGLIVMHGYTHQYSNVANPYSGVTGDDFEFYRAHISPDNYVIYDTPVAEDSIDWVLGRIQNGFNEFDLAGFNWPNFFVPPHYAGSAIDYQAFDSQFNARYDRGLFASGWCPKGACGAGTPDYTRIYGQYYTYVVRDIFGTIVIPEELGNVELVPFNHNPARFPADILYSANCNTVVQDGVESFFFHPYLDISYLKQIVEGLQGMGYTFVTSRSIKQGN